MRLARIVALILVLAACSRAPANRGAESGAADTGANLGATGIRFLGEGAATGFARATVPRDLSFPTDHGSHDAFRTEWWYFVGNVDGGDGSHFGFELTFFRIALSPAARSRSSAWGADQVWMAHFAVTDVARGRFATAERFARGALGLAGAEADPFRVWVNDWSVDGSMGARAADLRVTARDEEMSLALRLTSSKPPVAQGDRGLDAKGPEPGNASYYYSFPRLAASGSIEVDGVTTEVTGSAWIDREWGTSALSSGVVGWDWFALQLSDGSDLMYYRLRDASGAASPFSGGSIVNADGESRRLAAGDVRLTPVDYWSSERTGVRYPVAWRLEIPQEQATLEIAPYLEGQEVDLSVRYWEGAVRVVGSKGTSRLTGQGYLELAGY
jgi:predicted secreted hydrolase